LNKSIISADNKKTVLDNGLRIVTNTIQHTNGVSINYLFGAGSRYESVNLSGASHLFEHVLFKGTKKRPTPKEISSVVENVGGTINAFTDREITGYWCMIPKINYEDGIEVISDMIKNSLLRNEDIDNEKKVIYEEIRASIDSSPTKAQMNLERLIWPNQPLGQDIAGTVNSVEKISRTQMIKYLQSQYVASNTVIAVSGNIDHTEIVNQVEKNMGDFTEKKIQKMYPFKNNFEGPKIFFEERKTEQTNISIGFHGVSYKSKDRFALTLLSIILGGTMSSRLFEELREKRALAYDIHSSSQSFSDCGIFIIEAGIAPSNLNETIKILISELSKICNDVSEDEVLNSKRLAIGRMLLRMENSKSVANFIGTQELLENKIKNLNEIITMINSVSVNDIKNIATKIITPKKIGLSIIGPKCNEEKISNFLNF
tara:strand:- start:615 stop:1901 length:1287 start_codon:yes stop_codon:yes gene_type:complete